MPVRVPSTTAAEGAIANGKMAIGLVSPRIAGAPPGGPLHLSALYGGLRPGAFRFKIAFLNWLLVSVYSSGFPLVIKQNTNNNNQYLFSASQRPNATGVSPATSGDIGQRIDNWINPAAFSTAPALTFGNVSRHDFLARARAGQLGHLFI